LHCRYKVSKNGEVELLVTAMQCVSCEDQ